MVPLASLLLENRSFRVSSRTVADVTFPEVVSFPIRSRVQIAFDDSTIPALHVADEKETWGVIVEEGAGAEDLLKFDCICKENAQQFQRTNAVEIMMAIDPGTIPEDGDSP